MLHDLKAKKTKFLPWIWWPFYRFLSIFPPCPYIWRETLNWYLTNFLKLIFPIKEKKKKKREEFKKNATKYLLTKRLDFYEMGQFKILSLNQNQTKNLIFTFFLILGWWENHLGVNVYFFAVVVCLVFELIWVKQRNKIMKKTKEKFAKKEAVMILKRKACKVHATLQWSF